MTNEKAMGIEFERWVELTDTYAGLLDDTHTKLNQLRSTELTNLARDLIARLKIELSGSKKTSQL
ncbi:MAG: hypothetical protein EON54_06300 [Alcaligenaceae bacterium]|nr:MAG: hypothetical protein EON54_06300 [Alcaligenaceae bacterium]